MNQIYVLRNSVVLPGRSYRSYIKQWNQKPRKKILGIIGFCYLYLLVSLILLRVYLIRLHTQNLSKSTCIPSFVYSTEAAVTKSKY